MVGAFLEPSSGRRTTPIHSIPSSVAQALGEELDKLLLYNTRRYPIPKDHTEVLNNRKKAIEGIIEIDEVVLTKDHLMESENSSLFGEYSMQPWKNFKVVKNPNPGAKKYILDDANKAKTPSWWNDYNSVKHNRTGIYQKHSTNYAKANLRNLFYAFSALFILDVKLMEKHRLSKEIIPVELESKLFTDQLSFYTYLLCVDQKWQESEDEE